MLQDEGICPFLVQCFQIEYVFRFAEISKDEIIADFQNIVRFDIAMHTTTIVESNQTLNAPVTDELELHRYLNT